MCLPGPVAQCLETVVVQLDVESIVLLVTVEEREDLVHDLPARERWAFVFCGGSSSNTSIFLLNSAKIIFTIPLAIFQVQSPQLHLVHIKHDS